MVEAPEWLIKKDSYFYRPNFCGYTTSKFEAGRYTKTEADREAAVEPWHMKAIHQDDVEDDPVSSRVRMDADRIEALERQLAEALAERDEARRLFEERNRVAIERTGNAARVSALSAEVERLREALTPSADTKAAYWGEFYMGVTLRAGREEEYRRVQIPWDSIKEIMAAISARASLNGGSDHG